MARLVTLGRSCTGLGQFPVGPVDAGGGDHQGQNLSTGDEGWYGMGTGMTEKVVWHVVREYAGVAGIATLAPHDLRRSCARLRHASGGELEQIQFLPGHVSIQTTERYLGCKQRIKAAVRDRLAIRTTSLRATQALLTDSRPSGATYAVTARGCWDSVAFPLSIVVASSRSSAAPSPR